MSEPWLEGRSRQMPGVLCNPLGGPQSKIHALLGCCNPDAINDLVFCNPPNCKSIYLQSCYNSDRLPFDWTLIRKWAQGFRLRRLLRIRERTIAMLIQSSTITRIDEGLCSSKESLDNPPILAQSIQFWKFDQQSGNPRAIAQNLAILEHFQNCMIAIPPDRGWIASCMERFSLQTILWSFCNLSTIRKSCCNSMVPHNFHTIEDCPPITMQIRNPAANYGPVSAVLSWLTGIAK